MTTLERLKRSYGWCVRHCSGRPVVHHHVPKCGGTSINRVLRLRYILSQVDLDVDASYAVGRERASTNDEQEVLLQTYAFREEFLLYQLHAGVRCITGHVRFNEQAFSAFSDRYSFVTVLREPQSRLLSNYFHGLRSDGRSHTDKLLDEYLDSYRGSRSGAMYAEYFSGLPHGDFRSAEAIRLAKQNLSRLHLVGFTDDMGHFSRSLSGLLGVRVHIGRENRAPVPTADRRSDLSERVMQRVADCCSPDMEIYDHLHSRAVPTC